MHNIFRKNFAHIRRWLVLRWKSTNLEQNHIAQSSDPPTTICIKSPRSNVKNEYISYRSGAQGDNKDCLHHLAKRLKLPADRVSPLIYESQFPSTVFTQCHKYYATDRKLNHIFFENKEVINSENNDGSRCEVIKIFHATIANCSYLTFEKICWT